MTKINLRPWQAEAINKSHQWFLSGERVFLIDAAPGAGKTICASVIARRLLEESRIERVIIIAPRREVVNQWADEFKQVTGREITKVTITDKNDGDIDGYGTDLCTTWQSVDGLMDAFHHICKNNKTLIICDEHHHASEDAVWGQSADSAFSQAKYILALSGTPTRSDGKEPIWFDYNDIGKINHPADGTYQLTYGKAVDYKYCRPITFHRHEGKFTVMLDNTLGISVSGNNDPELPDEYKRLKGLQRALDYYKLVCTPKYLEDNKTPDRESYQATMLEWGIAKLDDLRNTMPSAGGLVIAPSIQVAEYMADLLEILDDEKPMVVHSNTPNAENTIKAFRSNKKRWIVSVAMISEGVDIKRLRVLVYLPNAQTELSFRQAMGRVVRTVGENDISRAYVVMPTHKIFEEYARRVENEMSPSQKKEPSAQTQKICGYCGHENPIDATHCEYCDEEFPVRRNFKPCPDCGESNPLSSTECQFCGHSFQHPFGITLEEALREGAIIRGMDIDEETVREGERIAEDLINQVRHSGDLKLVDLIKVLPKESFGKLKKMIDKSE